MERRRESAEAAALSIAWTIFFFLYLEGFIGVKEDGSLFRPCTWVGKRELSFSIMMFHLCFFNRFNRLRLHMYGNDEKYRV